MAAFTFYGTSLKGFRAGFDPEQGLVVRRHSSPECVLVLRRVRELGGVRGPGRSQGGWIAAIRRSLSRAEIRRCEQL